MNAGGDVTPFIQPKSDQLNADDLKTGPVIVRLDAWARTGDKQPIALKISGPDMDAREINGAKRPWKPCKATMRVMAELWGANMEEWVGRSVRLYCDPDVAYGGAKVGGIRISGMSHIRSAVVVKETVSRGTRIERRVEVIQPPQPKQAATQNPNGWDRTDLFRRLDTELGKLDAARSDMKAYLIEQGRELNTVADIDDKTLAAVVAALEKGSTRFAGWLHAKRAAESSPQPALEPFEEIPL